MSDDDRFFRRSVPSDCFFIFHLHFLLCKLYRKWWSIHVCFDFSIGLNKAFAERFLLPFLLKRLHIDQDSKRTRASKVSEVQTFPEWKLRKRPSSVTLSVFIIVFERFRSGRTIVFLWPPRYWRNAKILQVDIFI